MPDDASKTTLSVVLPTYNCRRLLERHLPAMRAWADLADEIIVVDSRSSDGTLELLRRELRHPGLRIIERDRGLYESWNEGIAATRGRWVYVSTVGDLITREHLARLLAHGEASGADAVVSPQRFVDEDGAPWRGSGFTNADIHRLYAGRGVVVLEPPATRYHAFRRGRIHALLGSWASDLFRGDFLRARPLPTDYGTHGDTAWTLRHSGEMRLCLVPEAGADFCIHAKEGGPPPPIGPVLDRMFATESASILSGPASPLLAEQAELLRMAAACQQERLRRKALWRGGPGASRDPIGSLSAGVRHLAMKIRLRAAERAFAERLAPYIRAER